MVVANRLERGEVGGGGDERYKAAALHNKCELRRWQVMIGGAWRDSAWEAAIDYLSIELHLQCALLHSLPQLR